MKLQSKITLTLLIISLFSAATVGIVAYTLLMRDFGRASEKQAFLNFISDITAYLKMYGSLDNGEQKEPFHNFAIKRHNLTTDSENNKTPPLRQDQPPFRFMLLSPEGRVVKYGVDYRQGALVPERILKQSHPVMVDGEIKMRAVQQGAPQLSPQDILYLKIIKKALLAGIIASGSFAILISLLLGRRFTCFLRELINAFGAVSFDRQPQREIAFQSKDEMGQVIEAFNQMNTSLSQAHAELKSSHDKIEKQARKFEELSIRDPLTHLYNRRCFDAHAETMFAQAVRYQKPFSVVIGDLDHFKRINDCFSHAVGDEVLRTTARLLNDNTRRSDLVARYGGEEFVMAFTEASLEQANRFCEKIRSIIEHYPWETIHQGLEVTMSMGICSESALGNVDKMVRAADEQLYESKKRGRNRVMPMLLKAI